jgi:hypothetical protein
MLNLAHDVRCKTESIQQPTIEEAKDDNELVYEQDFPKRAFTQASKVRSNKGAVNRIREAKEKADSMANKDGNQAVFQYQFEMQNKDEET